MSRGGARPGAGRPRKKRHIDSTKPSLPAGKILDPLTYMLQVMNDPSEDKDLRARMAVSAAPYIHARKGEGAGKKQDKAERAKAAGSGKFAPSRPPSLKVVKR